MNKKTLLLTGSPFFDENALAMQFYKAGLLIPRDDYRVDLSQDFDALEVSFRNLGHPRPYFPVSTLAMLALMIRAVAETNRNVNIVLPAPYKGNRSSLQRLLSNLAFVKLFKESDKAWTKKVSFDGRIADVQPADQPGGERYVPFRWFDGSWFNYDETKDPYSITPRIRGFKEKELSEILVTQGFIDQDAIDLFIHVMFLELAWNTILHSVQSSGSGYGIVGAQIRHIIPEDKSHQEFQGVRNLNFYIGDFGLGIPYTLRQCHETAGKPYEDEDCKAPTAIVRFSIEPKASSRPRFPDEDYKKGHRGLARVADVTRPSGKLLSGSLSLLSGGGKLRLTGEDLIVRPKIDDSFCRTPIPGTHIAAELRVKREHITKVTARDHKLELKPDIRFAASFSETGETQLRDATRVLQDIRNPFLVIDLGFADIDTRGLERIVDATVSIPKNTNIIFWNVRSQWSQFRNIVDNYYSFPVQDRKNILFIRGTNDSKGLLPDLAQRGHFGHEYFGKLFELNYDSVKGVKDKLVSVNIPIGVYININVLVNSHYLEEGFKIGGNDQGFFSGRIHLLGGREVDRYFSIARNLTEDTALRRWISTCGAGLLSILKVSNAPTKDVIILGLGCSVHDIIVQTFMEYNISHPAYTLMTYDLPSKEELENTIRDRSSVILITDVVSSASLLTVAIHLIERLGKKILGVIALVDVRVRPKDILFSNTIFVKGAVLNIITGDQSRIDREWWVDPVSLVPTPTRLFGKDIDQRIDDTLNILSESNAAKCGHIVDGQRHMTTYVDMRRLIENKAEWLTKRVQIECNKRLAQRGWEKFNPSFVLHPSGITRIASINHPANDGNEVITYQSSVGQYLPLLQNVWPGIVPVKVARAFDPGGRPRCARSLETPRIDKMNTSDIVIADDCLWSGRASGQLTEIAISLGARRVLIVPLLARINREDMEQWERIHDLSSAQKLIVEVCYVFPLVLPIPSQTISDCPYEITIRKLQKWTRRSRSLQEQEDSVRLNLGGRPPNQVSIHPRDYAATWLWLRAYSELASEDQNALDILTSHLKEPQRFNRLALLTLFLEDWSVLGRSRLRQTVRPMLREIAVDTLSMEKGTSEERIAACSLLRSLYPENFVESLPLVIDRLAGDINLLGRVIFHISSLPYSLRTARETISFLQGVISDIEWGMKGVNDEQAVRLAGLMTVCRLLLMVKKDSPSEIKTPRQSVLELLDLLEKDPTLTHEVRALFEVMAQRKMPMREFSSQTLSRFYDRWQEYYKKFFETKIFPLLSSFEATLQLTLCGGSHVSNSDSEYFTDIRSRYGNFITDIMAFSGNLKYLSDGKKHDMYYKSIVDTATNIDNYVMKKDSVLIKALQSMRGPTVREFLGFIEEDIKALVVLEKQLHINIPIIERGVADRNIFCPMEISQTGYLAIVENIRRHAFSHTLPKKPEVCIKMEFSENLNDPKVFFLILNNGNQLDTLKSTSRATKRAAADLRHFGGVLHDPATARDEEWTVEQGIEFLLV